MDTSNFQVGFWIGIAIGMVTLFLLQGWYNQELPGGYLIGGFLFLWFFWRTRTKE